MPFLLDMISPSLTMASHDRLPGRIHIQMMGNQFQSRIFSRIHNNTALRLSICIRSLKFPVGRGTLPCSPLDSIVFQSVSTSIPIEEASLDSSCECPEPTTTQRNEELSSRQQLRSFSLLVIDFHPQTEAKAVPPTAGRDQQQQSDQ